MLKVSHCTAEPDFARRPPFLTVEQLFGVFENLPQLLSLTSEDEDTIVVGESRPSS